MGMHDSSSSLLVRLIQKFRYLISFDSNTVPCGVEAMDKNLNTCYVCKRGVIKLDLLKYHCQSCGSQFCENCRHLEENVRSCKLCSEFALPSRSGGKWSGKVYPSESPRQSPEPPSPSFSGDSRSVHTQSSDVLSSNYASPDSVLCSTSRNDHDEGEQLTSHFFSAPIEYLHDISDVDSSSVVSARHEFYNSMSLGSSGRSDGLHISSSRVGLYEQINNPIPIDRVRTVLEKPANLQPLDFETNSLIWFPPPPDDADDEIENKLFTYDDDDDDVGDSGCVFSPTDNIGTVFSGKEKRDFDHKETWRGAVEGHFRALVSQLLQTEGIIVTKDNGGEDWVDIVMTIAWQTAKFLKPNTNRGGSMDPCDYLKVKCVASGNRGESKLIKGAVCTKNLKHKRMMSQYKNARLLLLGGSLEYQRIPNQLASFETLLQQENDHLKTIVSKIEAHRPNVLLVEKTVSSFALEHLLAKEISLVLNVKRPLLERIAKCTGASITPSTEHISATRLGHCELFRLEKVQEEHEPVNQFKKKPTKTLMFFEGCPRRLGCTVILRGSCREELKKVKHVVQYAVFAAYHLSLETSFLADEGAGLPISPVKSLHLSPEEITSSNINSLSADHDLELGLQDSQSELGNSNHDYISTTDEFRYKESLCEAFNENLVLDEVMGPTYPGAGNSQSDDGEYFPANDTHQSILVSFSSHCMSSGTVCERSRLVRLKFYGPSDKPLGRYLRDDLFDQTKTCQSCKESVEAHVVCYTHQHANLTINVKCLPSVKLPGEQDGKIWMWHRCLRCVHVDGVPPATRRVVMSDAAWGLSFGKFLELSFSSHTTGNRVASCGHSLQRDCLRFYGFGSMVAFFRYSPINIHSVRLPPSILEFSCPGEQTWMRNETNELLCKARALHAEVSGFLEEFKFKSSSVVDEFSDALELHDHIMDLNDILSNEKRYYEDLLQVADENPEHDQLTFDIFKINRARHSLLIGSRVWDCRLYLLDNLLKSSTPKPLIDLATLDNYSIIRTKGSRLDIGVKDNISEYPRLDEHPNETRLIINEGLQDDEGDISFTSSLERHLSAGSMLSDQIDLAWSGADLAIPLNDNSLYTDLQDNQSIRRLTGPTRVYSFDSAQMLNERIRKVPPTLSQYLSNVRSFHASRDYRHMVRDPVMMVQSMYSQISPRDAEKLNSSPSFISCVPSLPQGARLMVVQNGNKDIVFTVYENEPSSVISFALSSKQYDDWIVNGPSYPEGGLSLGQLNKVNSGLSTWASSGSLDSDYTIYETYASENARNNSPHFRSSFEDEPSLSGGAGRMRFSVMCYFAKEFDSLRRKCCPSDVDFVRSLSRCKRWSAQGGKSNVYFAKSFDDRFIIKQVTKTELDSFEDFAPEYFKYLTDAVSSGSPTCLAKVLGIYQVTVKNMKGSKEVKMDLMVMENLFFGRNISKIYDLKGSVRSRYNPDTRGVNKVLLDMNLLETLRTNPIFLGSKAKRSLERAVWNDTSFLASVDVMDYSLLVGVDDEGKELVMGIIDFMRQYTWDKHLETWVKASGILGGPKNGSPTIISPMQYKKRFRKAMTSYFLTVPDQWSS